MIWVNRQCVCTTLGCDVVSTSVLYSIGYHPSVLILQICLAQGDNHLGGVRQRAMENEEGDEGLRPANTQMGTMMDIGGRSIYN